MTASYLANFFIEEARKNNNVFPSCSRMDDALIYGLTTDTSHAPEFVEVYTLPNFGDGPAQEAMKNQKQEETHEREEKVGMLFPNFISTK